MTSKVHRIAIAQTDADPADLDRNLQRMLGMIDKARQDGGQMVMFPELALSGYLIDPRFSDAAITLDSPIMRTLREASKDIDICFGFIEETATSLFYNSAAYLAEGRVRHLHRKVYLPTYGAFDERRYFGAGWDVSAFDTAIARSSMLICGDAWHLPLPYLAAHDGADILLFPVASSHEGLMETASSEAAWEWMCRSYALTLSCFVVLANRAGNDGKRQFWGGSFVIGPDGSTIAQSNTEGEDLLVVDLNLASLRQQRLKLPFRRDDSLAHTLQLGQRIMENKIRRDAFYGDANIDSTPPPKPR